MKSKIDKILAAAQRLLFQHGYRKVTMSDIAEAAGISRPTLYAEFPNKDAVLTALVERHLAEVVAKTAVELPRAKTLKARLSLILDIWVLEPFSSGAGTAGGQELMENIGTYVPEAINATYAELERQLAAVLEPAIKGKRSPSARDLAKLLALAAKGLKASSANVAELRRMLDGLVAMTVATTRDGRAS
jgi:AcrR family transcriptional regulator